MNSIKSFLYRFIKSLPGQLLFAILLALLLADRMTFQTAGFYFGISSAIKEILSFLLPVITFTYIFYALLGLNQKAPLLILGITLSVVCSNALAVLTSYGVSITVLPHVLSPEKTQTLSEISNTVEPLFLFSLPKWITADKAMIIGLLSGLLCIWIKSAGFKENSKKFSLFMYRLVNQVMRKGLIPVLPLYVFGFVLKICKEGNLSILSQTALRSLFIGYGLIVVYIILFYVVAARGNLKKGLEYLQNMLPAGITGFSTMSSVATIPVTILSTERNIKDSQYTNLVIPTTSNIHMLGDGLCIPLIAISLLILGAQPLPSFYSFIIFTMYYCIGKFSCAGVPGGGVIVILPIIQQYLGLNAEMIGLLTTIYVLQDSVFSMSNVMGNGAFAIATHGVFKKLGLVSNEDMLLEDSVDLS